MHLKKAKWRNNLGEPSAKKNKTTTNCSVTENAILYIVILVEISP